MATAYIRLGGVMGGNAPVYAPRPRITQDITSGASSVASTIEALPGDYARIVASGGNLRIEVGSAPVALATRGDIILAGTSIDIGPLNAGDKIAVIDAT